ncbi:MAG: valine--tRNA ligase [Endomicrobium sp.]|jgi:valyl-tRNA synthetase|nr:valine--tRNA ligase [Endomicrobium sp.]
MEKTYNFKEIEIKWAEYWINDKTFSAKPDKDKIPFTIIIPPPNITGHLHMGHALDNVLQDIIIRFKKIQGYNTLWLPGTDHGGIATQSVVEKFLKKEGKTRYDLGRKKFLEEIWQWKSLTESAILNQLKKLGCGLDWDRTAFTMDKNRSKAVEKSFVYLFNKGLIYRGKRLINWCARCSTALSDIEVEYDNEKSNLWYVKYSLKNSEEYIVVATTRPETIFGDTGVAVNPNDKRYTKFIGKTIILPLINREIKIVADRTVDKSFGTGAVKITPAHNVIDNDIAKRNQLDIVEIIDIKGTMINVPLEYCGLSVEVARKKIVKELDTMGLLVKTQDHVHSIAKCYRCYTKIEFLMSEQWFLNITKMSKKAIDVVNNNVISFYPESWKKSYILWLKNLKDWCISRQIWWGHRIPIYYCIDKNKNKKNCKPIASLSKPKECSYCKGKNFVRDEDVLDTWFSSALWPISVFNWGQNDNNEDLKYFYPTSVLVTGHDILYLWVARMIQFGLEFMKNIPFANVFIHGIVRDKQGKKMSKSLGNIVDPIMIINQYGADALRFTIAQNAAPGKDIQISNDSFLSARNFVNKIWNASRFVILNSENIGKFDINIKPSELADSWILAELTNTVLKVKTRYESYNIDAAAREIYDFFWTKYCNWYIEFSKIRISSTDLDAKKQVLSILIYILKFILQLISPIMPFISEEIWSILNKNTDDTKIISKSTLFEIKNNNIESINKMKIIQDIIIAIRTLRSEMNISPSVKIEAFFNILRNSKETTVIENENYIKQLAKINTIQFCKNMRKSKDYVTTVIGNFEIFLPLNKSIDIEKEKTKLTKKVALSKKEIEIAILKLNNKNFIKNAKYTEIKKIKINLDEAKLKVKKINEALKFLK